MEAIHRGRGVDASMAAPYLQAWLDECLGNHTECLDSFSGNRQASSTSGSLPGRLLLISTPGIESLAGGRLSIPQVRVVESHGRPIEPYIALSHCWGPPDKRPIDTTRSNIRRHLNNIPFEDLSVTFQDAVMTCFALKIRYLWIDSLCIVQDDVEDWKCESSRMSSIYGNYIVTFAA